MSADDSKKPKGDKTGAFFHTIMSTGGVLELETPGKAGEFKCMFQFATFRDAYLCVIVLSCSFTSIATMAIAD